MEDELDFEGLQKADHLVISFKNLDANQIRVWLDAINDRVLRPENQELVLEEMKRVGNALKVTVSARPYEPIDDDSNEG
jgi:hypothetical protein